DLADAGIRIVQPDLAQRQLNPRLLGDRRLRRQVFPLPLRQHDEVVEVRVLLADEVEAAPRLLLELDQSRRAWPDQQRGDPRGDLDAIGLATRARRERTQPALD